jgi:hypothetical protein
MEATEDGQFVTFELVANNPLPITVSWNMTVVACVQTMNKVMTELGSAMKKAHEINSKAPGFDPTDYGYKPGVILLNVGRHGIRRATLRSHTACVPMRCNM